MTALNKIEDCYSKFPGSATYELPESLDTRSLDMRSLDTKCEMRKNGNIFYLSLQYMPATIATVKQNLGYRSKVHYKTMLKNPTRKLSQFVYPSMTVEQLKILVTKLKTADPAKKKILRRHALEKSKEAEQLAAQKKKLFADLARATRARTRKSPPQIVESYRKRITKKKTPWPSAVKDAYFITAEPNPNSFGELATHPGIENNNGRWEIPMGGPEHVILPILKRYQGQTIRIVVMRPTEEDLNSYSDKKNFPKGQLFTTDRDHGDRPSAVKHYQVPIGNAKVNNFFRDDGIYFEWMFSIDEGGASWGYSADYLCYCEGAIILVLPAQSVIRHPIGSIQFFLNAPQTHCIFGPLRDYCLLRLTTVKTDGSRYVWNARLKAIERFEFEFSTGLPENKVQEVSDKLKFNFDFETPFSLSQYGKSKYLQVKCMGKAEKTFRFRITRVDHVEFIGPRLDDVGINSLTNAINAIEISREALTEMIYNMSDHDRANITFKKDKYGICTLNTLDTSYRINKGYTEACMDFEQEIGLRGLKLCGIQHENVVKFLRLATHFNSHVDTKRGRKMHAMSPYLHSWSDMLSGWRAERQAPLPKTCVEMMWWSLEEAIVYDRNGNNKGPRKYWHNSWFLHACTYRGPCYGDGYHPMVTDSPEWKQLSAKLIQLYYRRHFYRKMHQKLTTIDIKSSYATPHACSLYEGFPNKITDFRPTDKDEGPGFYLIHRIDFSNASEQFRGILKIMGNPVRKEVPYPRPVLKLLDREGVKYEIVAGAWAGGRQSRFDFEFPGSKDDDTGMFQKDESDTRFYAKWVGGCYQMQEENEFWMFGTPQYFAEFAPCERDCKVEFFIHEDLSEMKQDYVQEVRVTYKANKKMCCPQIPAYINSYEFIKVVDQLLVMDLTKVYRVQKDDITTSQTLSEFDLQPYMNVKETTSFKNECGNFYMNNTDSIQTTDIDLLHHMEEIQPRTSNPVESNEGRGGGGKTHFNAHDKGLVRTCYIAPGWLLARKKAGQFDMNSVKYRLHETTDPEVWREIDQNSNTLLVDEISMYSLEAAKFIMDRYKSHKIIFIGDPGAQLPLVQPRNAPPLTPYNAEKLGIPVIKFDTNFRCKCPKLQVILDEIREMTMRVTEDKKEIKERNNLHHPTHMLEDVTGKLYPLSQAECMPNLKGREVYVVEKKGGQKVFTTQQIMDRMKELLRGAGQLIKPEDVPSKYQIEDMILVSRRNEEAPFVKEWTDRLAPLMPVNVSAKLSLEKQPEILETTTEKRGDNFIIKKVPQTPRVKVNLCASRIQKYIVQANNHEYSNGEIVISTTPPPVKHEVVHAGTIHGAQGLDAEANLFIDPRKFFEQEHAYTALSRAQYLDKIFMIDIPEEEPKNEFAECKFYRITSSATDKVYVGHTTKSLDTRMKRHREDSKAKVKRKCMSSEIISVNPKKAKIELIEEYPCTNIQDARMRERYWVDKTPNCINKTTPGQGREGYNAKQQNK